MTSNKRWDSVGWGFFGAMLLLWTAPSIYLIYNMTSSSLTHGTRAGTGVALAFMAAGFTSWLANSMLDYRARRLEARDAMSGKPGGKSDREEPR